MRRQLLSLIAFFLLSTPLLAAVSLKPVAAGLQAPTDIVNAGDGSNRLFLVEQGGRVRILRDGVIQATPFLDISVLLSGGGERGLLGLAFHPNYAANGLLYVYYTRSADGAVSIARYTRSASNADRADPASAQVLLTIAKPFSNHNGGAIRFGPDGFLYLGVGDGGSGNDPNAYAQNLGILLGKILRIDVDHGSPYAIPADNPFAGSSNVGVRQEIWAIGVRNPWRISFDRVSGDLWIGDVGQGEREEVNHVARGVAGGLNFGWRMREGTRCTGLSGPYPCPSATLTDPVLEYDHTLGCSITGGVVYHGRLATVLRGQYLYADYCSGRIWAARRVDGGAWTSREVLKTGYKITTFGEDEQGEVYVADQAGGVLYRFVAPVSLPGSSLLLLD